MEHEVVVPMPAGQVRQALQDPALLARSVPGLSTEPAAVGGGPAEEIGGRLKLRIGTSTITYKGVLSLIEGREGVLTAFAEGQEARGSGEATATVRISVTEGTEQGTSVVRFTGDLSATGRLTEFDGETLDAAGRRLLDRFAATLASPDGSAGAGADSDAEGEAETGTDAEAGTDADAAEDVQDSEGSGDTEDSGDTDDVEKAEDSEDSATVVFLENRHEALDEDREDEPGDDLDDDLSDLIAFSDADAERFGLPLGDPDEADDVDEPAAGGAADDTPAAGIEREVSAELPAEPPFGYEPEPVLGGPVRRSIVGRSAEEVDHAPPRGPYAPALPARSARARAASRWGGDAGGIVVPGVGGRSTVPWMIGGGVALLGGTVVLVRALRRRR
ncbi:hypothetical protein [Kitasatospora purpeofusca]|uniref:hypothetical protein n=1 Tax=Kitasatospora purpeofusca TaxID=67352 RepID=UPI00224FF595|nr:hypothetical protein [Kitasatospora purpeofusca]MCX4754093.1 hypothetical protein [Kitasatospora purpeofusca]WSR33540.1 hypothetical protein OG715_22675 [Kitasatospora purpeofusca]WSR41624.1 hypothetical protein OG196_22480 [Kitasatospora purpeofusca]